MENGLYAAVKTNDTVHAVFVDQENLEFGQLNKMVNANRRQHEKELAHQRAAAEQKVAAEQRVAAEKRAAAEQAWKAEEARKRKFRRMVGAAVKQELALTAAMAVVYYGFYVGLVSVFFAIPVLAVLLAVTCFKAGSFVTRIFRRRR